MATLTEKPGEFAVVTLVGPKDADVERLRRMLRSVFLYSSRVGKVVLIDDSPQGRPLEQECRLPAGIRCTVLPNERRGEGQGILGGACVGLLQALRHLAAHSPTLAVLKIDTDALVIAPFEEKARLLLAREPLLGTAGVVARNCDGSPRPWAPFDDVMQNLAKIVRWRKHVLLPRRIALGGGRWAVLGRTVRRARRQGYAWGEHSQGGSYLISRLLIERMRDQGYLEHGKYWLHIYMCEDPMMGLYARACGLQNVASSEAGDIFGVAHQGLPLPPRELLARGYSIVHSVKNDPRFSESEVCDFFARLSTPAIPATTN